MQSGRRLWNFVSTLERKAKLQFIHLFFFNNYKLITQKELASLKSEIDITTDLKDSTPESAHKVVLKRSEWNSFQPT